MMDIVIGHASTDEVLTSEVIEAIPTQSTFLQPYFV
jgi:hypothetical protein